MEFITNNIEFISLSIGIVIFSTFTIAAIVSIVEKEKHAAKISLFLAFLLSSPFCVITQFEIPFKFEINMIAVILILIFSIILILPINHKSIKLPDNPKLQIDERDTMFSRKTLSHNKEQYKKYYAKYPEKETLDDQFRKEPGLLAKNSFYYHPLSFASTDASFFAVEYFKNAVDGKIASEKQNIPPKEIANYIKNWSKKLGALDTGITELKNYHLYNYGGRDFNYGEKIINKHKYAIAFTVEMDKNMLAAAPAGPTVMESAQQYLNAGSIAVQLAAFIRNLGYPAKAHIDGKYDVVCPLVARDAGLGEIGRMGLLMTEKLGPRVRIGVVTTDIPLELDNYTIDPSVIDFCTICKKCADICPSQAISFNNMEEIEGLSRWQINQEACYTFWAKAGTDCGRCVSVCPYSHPDNILHNLIRAGINNSSVFRRFALKMDDILYGRKPASNPFPSWIDS